MPRNTAACTRCALPLAPTPASTPADTGRLCGQCLTAAPAYHRVIAPWVYGEYMAHLIHRWKYNRETRLTTLLAHLWRQQVSVFPEVDLLVPVPLHWLRFWFRGFNQSALLATELRHHGNSPAGLPVAPGLVKRVRRTPPQSGLGVAPRRANLHSAFTVTGPCDNLRVAIVDDVLTTGATASAMASALTGAGARHIEVWCLARTPARDI